MEKEENSNDKQSLAEERIELFLKGQMTPDEALLFRQEMKENEEFRLKALSMALLIKGMQKSGKEHDKAIINEVRTVDKKPSSKVKYYIMQGLAAAACVCIVFSIYDYHDAKYETTNLAMACIDKYNPPLPGIDDISRGRGDSSNAEAEKQVLLDLNRVFDSIRKNEDIQSCIEYLKPKFDIAASSKLNDYTPYLKHIGYYLAIAQLHENDRKAAKETLQNLLRIEPDFSEAQELLDNISDIKCFWE